MTTIYRNFLGSLADSDRLKAALNRSLTAAEFVQTERWLVWKSLQSGARILSSVFFDLKVAGLENIPRHGGALIVSNHQSNLDPILLNTQLRRPLGFLAKSELFETRVLSRLLRSVGVIPVHQGVPDVAAMRASIKHLRAGHLLSVYPEGSRTHDGKIARMEKGIALIDQRAHVPVIPAVIVGAYEAWPWNRTIPRAGTVRMDIGAPMQRADLSTDEVLSAIDRRLREMFGELMEKTFSRSRKSA